MTTIEALVSDLRGMALEEFEKHGPHDARGAAIWDVAARLSEKVGSDLDT